ncbi:DUF3152 domain-containing protein [Streptomyces sp. NPDC088116]|uniref:DUF3152 domain-containing protein n=1 Tax=Streptomyces sp. NPDC088116 TaxID=3365825 RepID=UPI0038187302
MGKRAAVRRRVTGTCRATGTSGNSRYGGAGRSTGGGRRRRATPLVLAGLALVVGIVCGGVAVAAWQGGRADTGTSTKDEAAAEPVVPTGTAAAERLSSPTTSPSASPEPSPSDSASAPGSAPSASSSADVPASGPGTFTTAQAQGAKAGSGPLRRYRVQVEDGIDVSASGAATEIQRILAHPRGWAAHGRGSFQLVSSNADFVIRIATPATADKLCLAQGLDTGGELNCETTDGVVVNLRRWLLGSPTFDGPPADYRHLIINHEVGHEIGIRQHLGCAGPGRLAPVMMQQIKGLDGCRANAWPYDEDGEYVTGPPA